MESVDKDAIEAPSHSTSSQTSVYCPACLDEHPGAPCGELTRGLG